MKSAIFIAALLCVAAISGCDHYKSVSGDVKVNEVTAYGNIRCVMPTSDDEGIAISCDWNHPIGSNQQ